MKLIDSVKYYFCKNDTLATIVYLETLEKEFPTDGTILMADKALADLYFTKGKTNEAKEKLLYSFSYKPINFPINLFRDSDICNKILNRYNYRSTKAGVCVALSQLYFKQKKYDSVFYFLNLADNEFLPYKECGNGVCMYKSYLSTYFADYYLAIGDTTKAIARLLDFFMIRDGDTKLLTQKLKSILLLKWTQNEIKIEVDKGLRNLKFVKGDYSSFDIYLTLFGHTIYDYGYDKISFYKKLYYYDQSLKTLAKE